MHVLPIFEIFSVVRSWLFLCGGRPRNSGREGGEGETSQVQIPFSDSNNDYKIFAEFLSKRSRLQRNFGESLRNST